MENRRRVEAGEFPLPEALIQQIQSFLTVREAAQTCILSKSWYTAWSTRPSLEFDQRDFGILDDERFWEFAKKTIQRYEALNLKIESFRLWMRNLPDSNCDLAEEFVVKAIKMGAVDLNFELRSRTTKFCLPLDVPGSETLIRLSVYGCKIDLGQDRNVRCRKLKYLNLNSIWLEDDLICDLISSCPFVETLTLNFVAVQNFSLVRINGLISSNLKSMFLGCVDVDTLFFSNLWDNFPCLKDLSLDNCCGYNYEGIQLSSRTLECISISEANRVFIANFDVPSIRKFKFSGSSWPSLSFRKASREWESDISILTHGSPRTAWFLKLKELLACLSLSKIYLSLGIFSISVKSVDFGGLPETVVEDLMINAPPSLCFKVLECLFWSCCPKFITLNLGHELDTREIVDNDFLEIIRERNVEEVRENCLMMNPKLEDVDVQMFEESVTERQPLPKKIHFRLEWGGGKA